MHGIAPAHGPSHMHGLGAGMAAWLGEEQLQEYTQLRRELGSLERGWSFLRCSVVEGGGRRMVVLRVEKEEWRALLLGVVMPFFTHSTQLVSPAMESPEKLGRLLGGEKLGAEEREQLGAEGEEGMFWLECLGCVRLAPKLRSDTPIEIAVQFGTLLVPQSDNLWAANRQSRIRTPSQSSQSRRGS